MDDRKYRRRRFRQLADALGTVFIGTLFFLIIIGACGLEWAFAGILLFVIGAFAVFPAFPGKGTNV
jgi:hypothetical protein